MILELLLLSFLFHVFPIYFSPISFLLSLAMVLALERQGWDVMGGETGHSEE